MKNIKTEKEDALIYCKCRRQSYWAAQWWLCRLTCLIISCSGQPGCRW